MTSSTDLRDIVRRLRARPGPAAVVVLTLAVGVGMNAAVFAVVDGLLLRPLPFADPGALVHVWSSGPSHPRDPLSLPDLSDLAQQSRALTGLAGVSTFAANVTGAGEPERLQGLSTTPGALSLLGVRPVLGRLPAPDEERGAGARVVVLTSGLWRKRFGGDPAVVGRMLIVNGTPHTVVGVLPPDFVLPGREADLVTPLLVDQDARRTNRAAGFLRGIARLKPGVTAEQASLDLGRVAQALAAAYPDSNATKPAVRVTGLHEELVGRVRVMVLALQAAALLVLAIACANLSSLLLTGVMARQEELAIRSALGASRAGLARLVLGETLLLALLGGLLGIVVAQGGLRMLLALAPADLPRVSRVAVDATVAAGTVLLSLLAGLACGAAPALLVLRREAPALLKGTRGSTSVSGLRARRWFVAVETALAVVVLAGAALLIQSFHRLQQVELGFDPAQLLTVRLSLPRSRYATPAQLVAFHDRLAERLRALPGVQTVGATSVTPFMDWRATIDFEVPGRAARPGDQPSAHYRMIDAGYLAALRVPLLRGRFFDERDRAGGAPVAIVNEGLARGFLDGHDPIGAALTIDDGGSPRTVQVVGVVGDIKHYGLDDPPSFDVYVPMPQVPQNVAVYLANNMSWVLRTTADPMSAAAAVRREVHGADPEVPASFVRSMDDALQATLAPRRFNLFLLEVFGVTALLLAALGIYAVTSQAVVHRTREMGVRMALGARPAQIQRLVFGEASRPIAIGLAAGLVAALASLRLAESLLFGIRATDPVTLLTTVLVLAAVAAGATYAPARRATRLDPVRALQVD